MPLDDVVGGRRSYLTVDLRQLNYISTCREERLCGIGGALTLVERMGGTPRLSDDDHEHGRLRRAWWDSGALSGGRPISLSRWESSGVSSARLDALLGESASSLAARTDEAAVEWLADIRAAWETHGSADEDTAPDGTSGDSAGDEPAGILEPIRPLILQACEALHSELGEALPAELFQPPVQQLGRMLMPVMALEVNVAREEGRIGSSDPNAAFAEFCAGFRKPSASLALLAEYPVLARAVVSVLRRWVSTCAELGARLVADLPALRETLGLSSDSTPSEVRLGAGDLHRGGRSVALLTFEDGRRLVYKPRPVEVDIAYNAFLDWLNALGLTRKLRPLTVLARDDYGWVEFVAPASCDTEEQVERFFWRQGAYLAVFYLLCGSDLHFENVIACGEDPVIVDVENLFQAMPRMLGLADAEPLLNGAVRSVRDSVLRIGLLPDHVIRVGDGSSYGTDISGLAGGAAGLSMMPMLMVSEHATDRMRMTRDRVRLDEASNRVRLNGSLVDLGDYRSELLDGFDECYRLVLAYRDELLGPEGIFNAFADARVRILLRPTATYAKLLAESWHPDVLRDALDRQYLFESLATAMEGVEEGDRIVASEVEQLLALDIPMFDTDANSAALFDGKDVVISDFLEAPGFEAARKRILAASEFDLARQKWFIDASLTGLTIGEFPAGAPPPRTPGKPSFAVPAGTLPPRTPGQAVSAVRQKDTSLDRGLAIDAATSIGYRLLESAIDDDRESTPSWLSLALIGDRYWRVGPSGADLYGGLAGIALFFGILDEVAPRTEFRRTSERIVAHLGALVDHLTEQRLLIPALGFSGYFGVGGLAYVFAELGRRWADDSLVGRVNRLASECVIGGADDQLSDVLSGVAGTAMAFAGIHGRSPSQEGFELLDLCGRRIAAQAIPVEDGGVAWPTDMETAQPLLGMSHGTSGIALALAEIFEATGREEYADLAKGALRFERRNLSREQGNWPDLRSFLEIPEYRNSWCHGAAGVGLTRSAISGRPVFDDVKDLIAEDLEIAVETVRRDILGTRRLARSDRDDCLCHGTLGLVGVLQAMAKATGRSELSELGKPAAGAVAERALKGELRCGVPRAFDAPGLMLGVAGIGLGLLRAADPDRVPDVLLLAPADENATRRAG